MKIDDLRKRLAAIKKDIGAVQIPTTKRAGERCWLSITEKDILAVYVDLLDIEAAMLVCGNTTVSLDVEGKLDLWSRAELPANTDPLFHDIQDRARSFLASKRGG